MSTIHSVDTMYRIQITISRIHKRIHVLKKSVHMLQWNNYQFNKYIDGNQARVALVQYNVPTYVCELQTVMAKVILFIELLFFNN